MLTTTKHGVYTFGVYGEFDVRTCGDCGVMWAMPVGFVEARRSDHRTWYCPNGHRWHYSGESDLERERRLRRQAEDARARERAYRDQAEASLRATKGVVTKQRKTLARVANGVCPCCNRSFSDLRRHMTTKHPDYRPEEKES